MKVLQLTLFGLCLLVASALAYEQVMPYKKYPASSVEAKPKKNSIQKIQVNGSEPFNVYCDVSTAGVGWLVIQRRVDATLNFFRNWTTYREGFGDLEAGYFIGLNRLHNLTASQPHELYVYLEDFTGQSRYAKYDNFAVGNETQQYALNALGNYNGTAGDSLSYSKYMKFSTYDRDNDNSTLNCAAQFVGAWWYNSCMYR